MEPAPVRLLTARERGDAGAALRLQRRLGLSRDLLDRLGLEAELHGHDGCVNCLEWSDDGSVLASASDDLRVILWDPVRHRALRSLHTGHAGNIFSVKFVSRGTVATGAADCAVRVSDVSAGAGDAQLVCKCHYGRVKRLATAHASPGVFWSGGEDGLVIQHDVREPHQCSSTGPRVLVNLVAQAGRHTEVKCVASSRRRPHHLAVGANDCYVRLYDTRMIRPTSLEGAREYWSFWQLHFEGVGRSDLATHVPRDAVRFYAPGHLATEPDADSLLKLAATYVSFSDDGRELLVNLGSEQIYLFSVDHAPRPQLLESYIVEYNQDRSAAAPPAPAECASLTPRAAALKEIANAHMATSAYAAAVDTYGAALALCPRHPALLANRAAALLRRAWAGDLYAAVRDCYAAIAADPAHMKSHFRLAKALLELRRPREAAACLLYFERRFPAHADAAVVRLLRKDVERALAADRGAARKPPARDPPDPEPPERALRLAARDYSARFLGHCNTTTDIKEATLLGPDAAYVAAGSDDGSLFLWCRRSGAVLRCLRADDSIVNCVQPHPAAPRLATSGIENVVRLWSPRPQDGSSEPRAVRSPARAAAANQLRMRSDPFESMLLNLGGSDALGHAPAPQCRAS